MFLLYGNHYRHHDCYYVVGVNHVDGPYPGLSPAAIDLIKQGKARFVVDWVRVVAARESAQ